MGILAGVTPAITLLYSHIGHDVNEPHLFNEINAGNVSLKDNKLIYKCIHVWNCYKIASCNTGRENHCVA